LEHRAREALAGDSTLLVRRCRHVGVAQEDVTVELGRGRE
jgi:hypothetical protein